MALRFTLVILLIAFLNACSKDEIIYKPTEIIDPYKLYKEGLVDSPPLYQICLGIPWGSPATTASMKVMADMVPDEANWAGFGIGRHQMPMVAQSVILGGNVRVGLEDNLYLEKGVLASNAQLVEKSSRIISDLGAKILTPKEARVKLNLKKHF